MWNYFRVIRTRTRSADIQDKMRKLLNKRFSYMALFNKNPGNWCGTTWGLLPDNTHSRMSCSLRSQLIRLANLQNKTRISLNKLFSQMALFEKSQPKCSYLLRGNMHSRMSCSLCSQLIHLANLQDKTHNLQNKLFSQMALFEKKISCNLHIYFRVTCTHKWTAPFACNSFVRPIYLFLVFHYFFGVTRTHE